MPLALAFLLLTLALLSLGLAEWLLRRDESRDGRGNETTATTP